MAVWEPGTNASFARVAKGITLYHRVITGDCWVMVNNRKVMLSRNDVAGGLVEFLDVLHEEGFLKD